MGGFSAGFLDARHVPPSQQPDYREGYGKSDAYVRERRDSQRRYGHQPRPAAQRQTRSHQLHADHCHHPTHQRQRKGPQQIQQRASKKKTQADLDQALQHIGAARTGAKGVLRRQTAGTVAHRHAAKEGGGYVHASHV